MLTKDNIKIKLVLEKCISIMCKETRDNKMKQYLFWVKSPVGYRMK